MQFNNIIDQVLANVGRFGIGDANDLILVQRNINQAIDEIKSNTIIPGLLQDLTPIILVNGTQDYTLNTDLDLIVRLSIRTSDSEGFLTKVTPQNVLKKVRTTIDTGTPTFYRLFGSTAAGVPRLRTYPIYDGGLSGPSIAGEYLPVLAFLSGTGENLITIKYFNSVIRIATELAYRSLIEHKTSPLQNTIIIKKIIQEEADFIQDRESSSGDYSADPQTDNQTRLLRASRLNP